jgi:hypothetical protein
MSPPVMISEEEEYELDAVADFNLLKSKMENVPGEAKFKVQWKGSYANTWHSPNDFGNALYDLIAFLQYVSKHD